MGRFLAGSTAHAWHPAARLYHTRKPIGPHATCCDAGCYSSINERRIFSVCRAWWTAGVAAVSLSIRSSNVLIIGPTGVGKTYLACALAHKACREGYAALYFRLPRLLQELALARGDGRYVSLLKTIARADLLVLDDWGLKGFSTEQQHDLLEILEDRHGLRSTLITSQLPVDHWHELITNSTVADAICDRLVHNGYRITLKGESMRKLKNQLT